MNLKKTREKLIDINGWLTTEVEKKTLELKKSNDRLRSVNEDLKMLDVAKNDFLNSISHELRTPLNGIVGSINLLKTLTHDDYIQEIVTLLDSSVSNLEKYSYAALQISNLQLKGESQLSLKPLDLLPVVRSILIGFSEKAKAQQIEIKFTSNCTEAIVNADQEFIQNAISSLLECSLTFTKEGFIHVYVLNENDKILFKIIDSGSLYHGEELSHYFKSVSYQKYKLERNNAMELYLAKMIILLHKGKVELENLEDNSGTITLFYLTKTTM